MKSCWFTVILGIETCSSHTYLVAEILIGSGSATFIYKSFVAEETSKNVTKTSLTKKDRGRRSACQELIGKNSTKMGEEQLLIKRLAKHIVEPLDWKVRCASEPEGHAVGKCAQGALHNNLAWLGGGHGFEASVVENYGLIEDSMRSTSKEVGEPAVDRLLARGAGEFLSKSGSTVGIVTLEVVATNVRQVSQLGLWWGPERGHPGNKIPSISRVFTGLSVMLCQATIGGLSVGKLMRDQEILKRGVKEMVGIYHQLVSVVEVACQWAQMKGEMCYRVNSYRVVYKVDFSVLRKALSFLNSSLGDVAHADSSAHQLHVHAIQDDSLGC